jgi:hypothetical protein
MRPAVGLIVCLISLTAGVVVRQALTDSDYLYLRAEFGLAKNSFTMKTIGADEQAKLHELINDPTRKDRPKSRDVNVADYLFDVRMRTCQSWQLSHPGQDCFEVTDDAARPGWRIADRQCNACHLTGTTDAPSFFKLAQRDRWNEQKLADILATGHAMSPITRFGRLYQFAQIVTRCRRERQVARLALPARRLAMDLILLERHSALRADLGINVETVPLLIPLNHRGSP